MGGLSILSRIVQWKKFFVVSIVNIFPHSLKTEYLSFSQVCDVAVLISAPRLNKMGQLALGERCILPNKDQRLQVWVVFGSDGFVFGEP